MQQTPNDPQAASAHSPAAPAPAAVDRPAPPVFKFLGFMVVVAALYFGRDILLPLALAVLLSFALTPVVVWMTRRGMPRVPAVIAAVGIAFTIILIVAGIFVVQLGSLAGNITQYQSNIEAKVRSIKEIDVGSGVFERLSQMMHRLGRELEEPAPQEQGGTPATGEEPPEPVPVEVVDDSSPLELLGALTGRLIGPLTTGGIIIVVVIFMLLNREDLRDRFIRLVSAGDLQRTTEALQDATERVGRYLLMQLVVNITYGIPVAIGLWLIGVPNAPLWGLLALVLRFVPYVGPIVAAAFPLLLAVAVDPGWTLVLWTAALFIVLELVSNNIVEPLLYGSRTGLSPLAIIVAAIFWTWLWGPMGLLMSTPLTVCLAVLGHYVPQFEFLDVILGTEPVLELKQQLYQRLLAGDPDEATALAEQSLEDKGIVEFYDSALIPALALGEADRAQGRIENARLQRLASSAHMLVENLEEYALPEEDPDPSGRAGAEVPPGPLGGKVIVCAGGRTVLDDAAAAMLVQLLSADGAAARLLEHRSLEPQRLPGLDLSGVDAIVIGFLNAHAGRRAKYLVRRIRRHGGVEVGVAFWSETAANLDAATIGADFLVGTMAGAVSAFSDQAFAVDAKTVTVPAPDRKAKADAGRA
jgi:predicted PurR-regulated permease PerM